MALVVLTTRAAAPGVCESHSSSADWSATGETPRADYPPSRGPGPRFLTASKSLDAGENRGCALRGETTPHESSRGRGVRQASAATALCRSGQRPPQWALADAAAEESP